MEQNQELTFYYVENKCPSQNINGNLALYPISIETQIENPAAYTAGFFLNKFLHLLDL